MHVLFEEDGGFKAGTILADNDTSLQVETVSGKRSKIKANNVLLRFAAPAPGELLQRAQATTQDFDADFLWEVSGDAEFGFTDLAEAYFGRKPEAVESAAVAMFLHGVPMYFYRRGKGRYQKAPADALKAALASIERKKREAETMAGWIADLKAGRLPDAFRPVVSKLLYGPDKNTLEWKALETACNELRTNPTRLIAQCGGIPSTHDFHFGRFLFNTFPKGIAFPRYSLPGQLPELPLAGAAAFSVDDTTTTEIDDAFSVEFKPGGGYRVGIHIAAPALGILPDSELDAIARARLSTVYMPGNKITMLPDDVVAQFSLDAGRTVPTLTMLLDADPDGLVTRVESRIENTPIAANLRHGEVDENFEAAPGQPFGRELIALNKVAGWLGAERRKRLSRPEVNRTDFNFYVDPLPEGGERIRIEPRLRGSPLDTLVAELMIFVNSSWGKLLADANVPGMYRAQTLGKTKMTTKPAPHQGLGLDQYAWASSPLRRYADLVNQRQIVAVLRGETPPYAAGSGELFGALADFDATYTLYGDFQRQMEHYWCLRWIEQERASMLTAKVIKENLVRFERLPIVMRVADAPNLGSGTLVNLQVAAIDLIEATLDVRFAGVLAESAAASSDPELTEEEAATND